MKFYQHWIGDYQKDTKRLSMMEHGAYRLLLDEYYSSEQPLPANAMQLHRICSAFAPEEQAAVQSVLESFFTLTDDGWINRRVEREIERSRQVTEKRKEAAEKRWNKEKKNDASADASADANDMQVHTQPQPHIKPIVGQIISHLNRVTGKTYSPDSKATVKHISGRLSEGYEFDHFRKAIDNQWSAWRGTDMEQYMRPQTLFNSEKFDGYVNNTKSGGKGYID